jgi:hypothetical protein
VSLGAFDGYADQGSGAGALMQRTHAVAGEEAAQAEEVALERAGEWLLATYKQDVRAASAGAVPFLHLFGIVAGGWQMGRAALIAQARQAGGDSDPFWAAKLATTRFFADHFLTQAAGLAESVVAGAAGVLEIADDSF